MSSIEIADAIDGRPAAPRARPASRVGLRLAGFLLPVVLAIIWEILVRAGLANGRLMPPPSVVGATLWQLAVSGELWTHAWATLWRVAAGFGIGAAVGTALGALTGALPLARGLLDPTLQALRAIPSIAWVPLFILWFGIFEASKVALIAVGVFFPVYLGVAAAILSIDRKIVEVGRVFRLGRLAMVRRVLLPAILPDWFTALRGGLGLGFMFVVAAEIMGASEGLGYLLVDGQQLGRPDTIIAAIIAFAVLGKLADGLLLGLTRPFLAWQDTARDRL
ncbi:Sulfonate transport system permease protein [Bosea sp. 62]|uniref:ABC transporter permease n=1 Tax=unclassified Bosea (in: a-proteobacteria) TaxID=2653178 RepID=UPI001257AD6F|nr:MULTISPECIES: ABC transporter permease [unclassified Bosea (in: a-proteobacteria)]CAD5295671.1 Sulfonate transport system permease protein [Bosea sp. 21B]CAD5296031.1 Sulfonate transport system permease protein [Bosea sp. 46]CAD5297960.1 Sulfonate transport system permease protein [Bosea sp. 7B]VVT61034.1 Sulfonate transport system permease protein [Bosea sp. EC-HK365B]VXB11723.1 Sulfonate transport system permease protein [Bosea sp. 125]